MGNHVTVGTEMKAMQLQVKELQGLMASTRRWEDQKRIL